MQTSNAGDSGRTTRPGAADFECQVGGVISLARLSDMDSHPPLPELTGTKDQQCQAHVITSDFQCQAKKSTTDIECQAKTSTDILSSPEQRSQLHDDHLSASVKQTLTTCSATQCDLLKQMHATDAQSQTEISTGHRVKTADTVSEGTGNPGPSPAAICSSRGQYVGAACDGGTLTPESRGITPGSAAPSSDVHCQTDGGSPQEPSLETDEQAVQAKPCSADVFSQTDCCSGHGTCGETKMGGGVLPGAAACPEKPTLSTAQRETRPALGGQPEHRQHSLCVQAWGSLDFQCQVWPDARDAGCQVGAASAP